ncbi:MAG: hypothetical protein QJR08_04180 [Bacillota bacterium]|nr:hypothetical protein [Bacillota bacterium]
MSYGPAVEVRWEDRETETGPETVGVGYRLHVEEFVGGLLDDSFQRWLDRHPGIEILDIKYAAASAHDEASYQYEGSKAQIVPMTFMLVIYREREAPAEAGAE